MLAQHFMGAQLYAPFLCIAFIGLQKQMSIRYDRRMLICSLLDQLILKKPPAIPVQQPLSLPGATSQTLHQITPVTVSTAVPGVTSHRPVMGSCWMVAPGTVITLGTVEKEPVAAS